MTDPSGEPGLAIEVISEVLGEGAKAVAVVIGADEIAAAALGGLSAGIVKALGRLTQRRRKQIETFAEATSDYGAAFEELVETALADDRKLDLLRRALESACRTADRERIRFYARMATQGVLSKDDAMVDQKDRVLSSLAALDPVDVKVLLQMQEPTDTVWTKNAPQRGPSLAEQMPEVATVLDAVLARLEVHGLITGHVGSSFLSSSPTWVVTDYGRFCVRQLLDRPESDSGGGDLPDA
jgi:hypothetical protein